MKIIIKDHTSVTAKNHSMRYCYDDRTTSIMSDDCDYGYISKMELDLQNANDLLDFLTKLKELNLI